CAAYKSVYPGIGPQEGNVWKVVYGRGWGMSTPGVEWFEGASLRCDREAFMRVEKMRWLSMALIAPEPSDAVAALTRDVTEAALKSIRSLEIAPLDTAPDITDTLVNFEAPRNTGNHYRSRLRGIVVPPRTGDYVFSVACDDDSELFLSSDASPDRKQSILQTQGWTAPNAFTRKSKPQSLIASRSYYIEVIHQEGTGADHVSVAWSGPDTFMEVISGAFLTSYPAGVKGEIVREVWHTSGYSERNWNRGVPTTKPEALIQVAPEVMHIEAEAFTAMDGVNVYDCYTGGKQVNFGKLVNVAWLDYAVDAPAVGTYQLTMRVAAVNFGQRLKVAVGWEAPIDVELPNSWGLWATTQPVDIELQKGHQTLKVAAPHQRGVALRWFELKRMPDPQSHGHDSPESL
ncbi:MAG: PA14 domain-containing protein, partial [Verrucomicrobia bacterium]|nr:PA14 domain-containing protein [Verrucomicrobiota bacterium]